jgi:hypothetical protein
VLDLYVLHLEDTRPPVPRSPFQIFAAEQLAQVCVRTGGGGQGVQCGLMYLLMAMPCPVLDYWKACCSSDRPTPDR